MKKYFNPYGIIKDGYKVKMMLDKLNEGQRNHLDLLVKEKSTMKWSEVLQYLMGGVDTVDVENSTLNGWRIHYVEDLAVQSGVCACGHKVRYLCHLEHLETGRKLSLGTTCVQKMIGISMESAKRIAIAMSDITCDRDEILLKIEQGWKMDDYHYTLLLQNLDLVSEEIQKLVTLGLPILCRHIIEIEKFG
jgi:hypothetical protein